MRDIPKTPSFQETERPMQRRPWLPAFRKRMVSGHQILPSARLGMSVVFEKEPPFANRVAERR